MPDCSRDQKHCATDRSMASSGRHRRVAERLRREAGFGLKNLGEEESEDGPAAGVLTHQLISQLGWA